eukprot:scaffold6241_cov129-Cylindrotheca_fusiformis.AAC.6
MVNSLNVPKLKTSTQNQNKTINTMFKPLLVFIILAQWHHETNGFFSPVPQPAQSSKLLYNRREQNANDATTTPQLHLERPRKRKKHVYKHIFRHYGDISFDSWLRCEDPECFLLSVGYDGEAVAELSKSYPPILTLNVHGQLAPKVRFLVETLGGGTGRLAWDESDTTDVPASLMTFDEECSAADADVPIHSMRLAESTRLAVPPSFYGCNLDRSVGPFHGYLASHNLPHGSQLLKNPPMLDQFLKASESIKTFAALCQEWRAPDDDREHSVDAINEFLGSFTPGLLPASKERGSSDRISLLLKHGYNPLEHDSHGISPLHWAAGAGNLQGVQSLTEALKKEEEASSLLDLLQITREPKEGATPFHWSCSGMTTSCEGGGGSLDICRWMLEEQAKDGDAGSLVDLSNLPTWTSQSTPLMYAAWGGSLEICQLLIEQGGADPLHTNSRGETALHWAAAAGNLGVCQYLVRLGFENDVSSMQSDHHGQTPLDAAMAFDRPDVVDWMMKIF